MKIGIFDSGVGGLTVLNTAMEMIPHAEYIYYADLDNVPYGTRDKDQVRKMTHEAITFLHDMGVDAVVIACNTATSTSVEFLRKSFDLPLIGMEPAVKPAIENSDEGKVIVMATELTLKEKKFKNLVSRLEGDGIVVSLPMPELVHMAEDFNFNHEDAVKLFRNKLEKYNLEEFSAIVLGCTHFVYFKNILEKMVPENISVIDGNLGTISHLIKILKENDKYVESVGSVEYYVSGRKAVPEQFEKYLAYLKENNI
ncbi:glutamate racemase [Dethiosulfatibacter aminovorans DSM 17477]|uniref:Glutamate racemase n=1 Tax=Dethiosulfatibacter aminovorans DSM 17477 TaxID=1121476 RepID=A0A1M6FQ90_9FIRM|nr:glutamate racemase [Dethiosulfatibacter aminovorans]SHI99857.1 glutamate racemase [Dethiosulfatibacter aminovorans DSM 17477]